VHYIDRAGRHLIFGTSCTITHGSPCPCCRPVIRITPPSASMVWVASSATVTAHLSRRVASNRSDRRRSWRRRTAIYETTANLCIKSSVTKIQMGTMGETRSNDMLQT
jgi:hypothetical protein